MIIRLNIVSSKDFCRMLDICTSFVKTEEKEYLEVSLKYP